MRSAKMYMTFIALSVTLAALAGCEEMPKDDMVYRVGLSVDIPGASMSSAANSSGDGRALDASALPEGYNIVSDGPFESSMFDPAGSYGVPLAGATTYHLRVIISDPREEHFVFNYVPGSVADITAASGVERLITVEAYEIAAMSPGMGMLTARHFVTITPSSDRTVSLVGQPVRLSITVAENLDTGAIVVNPPFPVSTPSGTVNLPPASSCPTEFGYYATVTDHVWGLSFPSFPVLPYSGAVHQTVSVSGLPKGRTFTFLVQHSSVDLTAVTDVYVESASQEATLSFTGVSNPSIVLSPEKDLVDLVPGEIVKVGVDASGGWGSLGSASVGGYDSCSGSISGATYSFMVPYGRDFCNIHVAASDCGGGYGEVQKIARIDKQPPPQCMDGADNDQDGLIDYPQDPGCASAYENNELGATACDDGIDNDGDGYRDMYDPGCSSPTDSSELGTTACDDGIDGDGWGDSDVSDPGCSGPADNSELGANACDDGIDNDGWGDTDWADPGCSSAIGSSELSGTACDDGINNDSDGLVDSADPGCADASDSAETDPGVECDDGVDNDTWGDIDSADPACLSPTGMTELLGTECDDNIDNDGWGDTDSADPGCSSPAGVTEYSGTACDDGVDNDGWLDIDVLDPGCSGAADSSEYGAGACDDGINNDSDGLVDIADPGCADASDSAETDPGVECDDGVDNDTWGDIDMADPACSSPTDITELLGTECDDNIDNDGWGDADNDDPGCSDPGDTSEYGSGDCDDGVDNDGWGDVDIDDTGCLDSGDASESGYGQLCDDGVDNDGDGQTDFNDPQCVSSGGVFERALWFVATDGDNTTGQTWANAYTGIRTAISSASAGDAVFVKEGTYPGVNNAPYGAAVHMKDNVQLYGGFAGTESFLSQRGHPFDHPTIIDGQNVAHHGVVGASYTRLDGFHVTGGGAPGSDQGGAMYILWAQNYTVHQCVFYGNNVDSHAGAIYNYKGSNIVISDCVFYNNSTDGIATWGGSTYGGGAIWNTDSYSTVRNCLFYNNQAGGPYGYGAAVASNGAGSGMNIENCTFAGNSASSSGGAIALFNSAQVNIVNSILRGNSPNEIYIGSGSLSIDYSIVQGGYAGTGNLDTDPLFVVGPRGNYYLSHTGPQGAQSPAVDAGYGEAWSFGLLFHTTRTDGILDVLETDMGYHHPLP